MDQASHLQSHRFYTSRAGRTYYILGELRRPFWYKVLDDMGAVDHITKQQTKQMVSKVPTAEDERRVQEWKKRFLHSVGMEDRPGIMAYMVRMEVRDYGCTGTAPVALPTEPAIQAVKAMLARRKEAHRRSVLPAD